MIVTELVDVDTISRDTPVSIANFDAAHILNPLITEEVDTGVSLVSVCVVLQQPPPYAVHIGCVLADDVVDILLVNFDCGPT